MGLGLGLWAQTLPKAKHATTGQARRAEGDEYDAAVVTVIASFPVRDQRCAKSRKP